MEGNAEARAKRAAQNGVSIYARLMAFATDEPRQELYQRIETEVRAFTGDFAELMAEQLRRSYVAGVADGWAEAIRESEPEPKVSFCWHCRVADDTSEPTCKQCGGVVQIISSEEAIQAGLRSRP